MNLPALPLTLAILVTAVLLILSDRLRADLVALLVLVALGISGILPPQEVFSGFSRSAVITIMAISILAEGLRRTGVTDRMGDLLLRLVGRRESHLVVGTMLAGAMLSLLMNNIAAAAILLPTVSAAARKASITPTRLLMPLAFGTLLGGMATLLTTTNIVVSGLLIDQGLRGFGLLDFAPVGLPLVALGVAYMALWGHRMLPIQPIWERTEGVRPSEEDLVQLYHLGERLFRARVPAGSHLIDTPLSRSAFRELYGLNVVGLERNGRVTLAPSPDFVFREGDVVLLEGNLEEFRHRDQPPYLEILPPREWREEDLESPAVVIVEAVLSPRSGLIGQTLRAAQFREKYGFTVLAIWRAGRPIRTHLSELPLQFGDALLLQGPRERLPVLRSEPDLILLANEKEYRPVARKGWLAAAIAGIALVLAAFRYQAVAEIFLGGALMMMLAGVLTMDQAYGVIEWKTVFLVAGMMPLGIAMTKSGAATWLAGRVLGLIGPAGPIGLMAGLFLLAMGLAQVMHSAVVASIVAPFAIQIALQTSISPQALAMTVALATSTTFLTPLGHPVNVLVMNVGGYRTRDYFRVGWPLTLLVFGAVLVLVPIFWPLR
ncbi:MAG: SLC13 family permease [Anaerolineae bacterium]|nr:SLC13 family permease [Anaerolineae bacterium]MDW8068508.1 SLC13 family permease [Anaerolineae bacterium]